MNRQAPCVVSCWWGEDTHLWSATKGGKPIPATILVDHNKKPRQVTTKNQETTHTSHYNSRRYKQISKKLQWYTGYEKITICNKFLQTHLYHPQFLEHRLSWWSEEPLRSVASKSCQLVDRRANECISQRCVFEFWLLSSKEPCNAMFTGWKMYSLTNYSQYISFYAFQPRWLWIPGCIRSLDLGDCVQEHPQPWHPTPAVYPFPKETWEHCLDFCHHSGTTHMAPALKACREITTSALWPNWE